jgi:hypothetical protein
VVALLENCGWIHKLQKSKKTSREAIISSTCKINTNTDNVVLKIERSVCSNKIACILQKMAF